MLSLSKIIDSVVQNEPFKRSTSTPICGEPLYCLASRKIGCSHVVHSLFEDKRLTSCLLVVWLSIVLYLFSHMGLMQTQFMSFGPSERTYFMSIQLNTWPRWAFVAVFTFVSTSINDFVGDSLVPFITNVLQDPKTKYLPYSKFTCWFITQILGVYSCTMSIFSIYLLMSQLDFMLIRMTADSVVNVYTMHRFMKNKVFNKAKYEKYHQRCEANDDSEHETADMCSKCAAAGESDKECNKEDTLKNERETENDRREREHGLDIMVPIAAVIMKEELDNEPVAESKVISPGETSATVAESQPEAK